MRGYIRDGKYSIETVRELLGDKIFSFDKIDVEFHGKIIKANSQRYKLFFTKGCTCVKCGLKANYFALERGLKSLGNTNRYHFNLYGVDQDGVEVLFTKDHIIPKSKGGKNRVSNYQTMCYRCNQAKGTKLEDEIA